MDGTMILPCLCDHKDQDQMYGKGMRVHNLVDGKSGKGIGWACTVCTPRNLSCERNGDDIQPAPHMGLKVLIPRRRLRQLKPLNSQTATVKKKK